MAIMNLLELQPSTISRDLRDKYIMIYGKAKVGKTTFASQLPNNLIFCFEKGVNFLSGIYPVDIPQWTDFKAYLRQLAKPELHEKYHTITIDTLNLAWKLCERFICAQHNVKVIGEIPYGQGYDLLTNEFTNTLREISMMGYGVILIAHSKTTVKKDSNGEVISEKVAPNIPERAQIIVNAFVDIIGYIDVDYDEDGNSIRTLCTRETPNIVAGSRLKYLEPRIPFGYNELINAIYKAINKEEENGAHVTENNVEQQAINLRSFEDAMQEAKELWIKIVSQDENKGLDIIQRAREILGVRIDRLSEIKENQQYLLENLIEEMREM